VRKEVVVDLAGVELVLVSAGTVADEAEVGVDDPDAARARIEAAVQANPQAAAVLMPVVRSSLSHDVESALAFESLAYSTLLTGNEFRRWLQRRGPRPLPPVVTDPVRVRRESLHGGRDLLHVTLNRPDRRNAYGAQMRDALVEGLAIALADTDLDVVLDGAGPCFCAGGDLDEFGTAPDPVTAHLIRTRAGAALPLHQLADRLEASIHGPCIGAGIELPAFAGQVVAAQGTTFRLPELGMGLIPGAGGTVSIPRRIGVHRTLYLALSGDTLDVDTALAWGLVDDVIDRQAG
jgi:enoyl-CoA hydratase/carnithine racemase